MNVYVHAEEIGSRANGPGRRVVWWLQGCTLGCPGCYNPATHAQGGQARDVAELVTLLGNVALLNSAQVEGVTLTGGEPMQQPEASLALLRAARAHGLSTLLFSGYTLTEFRAMPLGPLVLAELDVLIDGRYDQTKHYAAGLLGSANQHIHLLTARYSLGDVQATPPLEIRISRSGEAVLSGVDPLRVRRQLRGRG